jgi:hypothetical protein
MLRASSLKSSAVYKAELQRMSTDLIQFVDEDIKKAYDSGKHRVSVAVPVTFAMKNMKNSDAQRIIYHALLTSLVEREFIVEIDMAQETTVFNISWVSEDEEAEIATQNHILASHAKRIQKKAV